MKKLLRLVVILILSVSIIAAFSFTGCKTTTATTSVAAETTTATTSVAAETTTATTTAAAEEKQTTQKINMTLLSGGAMPAVKLVSSAFTQKTGIEVILTGLENTALREKNFIELKSGSGNFDIVSLDPHWLVDVYNYLEPLDSYVEKDNFDLSNIFPTYLEMARFPSEYTVHPSDYKRGEGTLYGLPYRVGVYVLHYRKDLFEQEGIAVPKTLDELREAAKKLTKGGMYGMTIMGEQGPYLIAQFFSILWSFGGDILTPDMKSSALNSPEAIEAAEYLVNIYKDGYSPPATPTYNMDSNIAALQQGLGAMTIDYTARALVLNDPKKSQTAGKWRMAPVPSKSGDSAGVGVVSGWSAFINKNSKNKEAAWEFIKYLTSEPAQTIMAIEAANAPTLTSVFTNPDYQKVSPDALAVLEAAKTGRVQYGIPNITEIEDIIANEVNAALSGVKTTKEAMKAADERVNEVLQRK